MTHATDVINDNMTARTGEMDIRIIIRAKILIV